MIANIESLDNFYRMWVGLHMEQIYSSAHLNRFVIHYLCLGKGLKGFF